MCKIKKKYQKSAKKCQKRGSFSPSPVLPLINRTQNSPKITEHSAERSAERECSVSPWCFHFLGKYLCLMIGEFSSNGTK